MPGYSVKLDDNKVGGELLCVLCKKLLRKPVQTLCGHRCCASCVKEWKKDGESFDCPEDGELVTEIFPDRFVEREVLNLKVQCSNLQAGCKWTGLVRDFEAHVSTCPFVLINCPNEGCQVSMARDSLNRHAKDECQYRKIKCPLCMETITSKEKEKHQEQECLHSNVDCTRCGRQVKRTQFISHQEMDCEQTINSCPFSKVGCAATRPMKKQDRRKHMDKALNNHVTYLLMSLMEIQSKVENFGDEYGGRSAISVHVKEIRDAFGTLKSEFDLLLERINDLEHQLSAKNTPVDGCTSVTLLSDSELPHGRGETGMYRSLKHLSLSSQDTTISYDLTKEHTNQVSNMESNLHNYESLVNELKKKIDYRNRAIDALKDWNRRLERKVSSMEHELALKGITMVEQQEKLDVVEQASFNGVLIWAIDDFMKKRHDAITGKRVSLYSSVFYLGRHGYKLRVRIYLNGDGLGKGTHVSLFFVVCKGRYDALLSWPFKQKVTMMILDQDNIEHVVDSFRPDPQSSSFQKPKNEMNVASGCPLFMSLANLDTRSYVRDDTMFVKVTVDTSGLDHG